MDAVAASREEGLRRALLLALPVGTQIGSVGLESLGRAADGTLRFATWSVTSAVRTAGAGAAFVNRNLVAPLSSFAFGGSSSLSNNNTHFSTKTCPQLLLQEGRKQHPSRAQVRIQRVANNLRSGSAKCSIRRAPLPPAASLSRQTDLLAHLAASCALIPSSDMHDEHSHHSSDDGNVTQWTVNTLGLQSSLL